jgi:hypothetical protein
MWHQISQAGGRHLSSLTKLVLSDIYRRQWRHRNLLPLSCPKPGWKPGILGRTVFETYASTYLGRPVYTSRHEAEDWQENIRVHYTNDIDPLMPIRDHGSLRPVIASKDERPPGGLQHDNDNSLQNLEKDWNNRGDEKSDPQCNMTFPLSPALARP